MTPTDVRELTTDDEIAAAFPVMNELRPHLRAETFVDVVQRQRQGGYRLFALFVGGALVALAGVREGETLSRGPHLFVDDLVTRAADQGRGYGTTLLGWIAALSLELGHARVWLDSRDTALTFYQSVGFSATRGVPCWIEASDLVRPGRA